jgi:hypothetical protein
MNSRKRLARRKHRRELRKLRERRKAEGTKAS